ncbi:MAG: UDP-N-acetylglucosamine--N-acetylmuramyl-(pentapeptide) pyrophosphoryl-undecaprenol N-acetylglucosamine transferase [Candidatus Omnitrophica bacterium]|nr:UDP-N-acetylglucosamine--N-acetylmuramyl-(pentapeptide) pyrophosphoryl-undecaprenol N-acetylglucosamine transferase [Candidatus Omnitrophota bacterium]
MKKILVVSGASGGHIFPALAFIQGLKDKKDAAEILLVLPVNSVVRREIELLNVKVKYVAIFSLKPSLKIKNLLNVLKTFKSSLEAARDVLNFRPDLVVGFGSITSVAFVFWGWLFRANTLIHEQNVVPGAATVFLSYFADKIAVSFEGTKGYLTFSRSKVAFTGNPLRKDLVILPQQEALSYFGFSACKFTILVSGGSQGSSSINSAFISFLKECKFCAKLQVIHICGANDYAFLQEEYKSLNIEYKLFSYFDKMHYAYSASCFSVARSGAMTISELIRYKLPAVLVPYPYARCHQKANAQVLAQCGACSIVQDCDLSALVLNQIIEPLVCSEENLLKMRQSYQPLASIDALGNMIRLADSFFLP